MGILPNHLLKQTNLLLIYENRIIDVRLVTSVVNLEEQQHITVEIQLRVSVLGVFLLLDFTFKLFLFDTKTTFIFINSL